MIIALAVFFCQFVAACEIMKALLSQLESEYGRDGYRKELYSTHANFADLKAKIGVASDKITYEDPFFYHF
jgi:hypothetical protein